ncbi:AMP-binding enzyme, partial [Ruminobacter amylophilus]
SSELFRVKEDPEHRHDPFPLTEVQQAYWMGQAPGLPLNSKTYYLVEMEGSDISVERLNEAFRLVVGRHEMLRTEITADGQQVIREKALVTPVEVTRVADVKQAVSAVSAWWNELNDMNESFPYAARAFEYGKNSMRLAMAFSYMNLDGYSIKMILREIAEAYRNSEKYSSRPPLALSFRDYILSHGYSEEKLQEAHRYWDEKIDDLPPAPQLPTECSPDRIEKSHFVRIAGTLPHKELDSIKARAREFGLTPSAVFLHAYAEVLCRYSGTDGVTVNMTLFDRMNVHPEIYDVAGDFTSLVPVAYRPDTTGSFAASTGVLAENLAEALDHRELSSIYIQRELSKRKGLSMASLPVVFTSTLGIADDLLSQDTGAGFLTLAEGGLSETPQVWLDHQLYETADGLYLSWDYVSELYDGNLIREMFECYMELIHRLVTESWQLNIQAELPKETVRIRTVVNTTSAPLSSLLLAERIHMNGITMADSPALFYGDRIVTYGQMHASVMRVASLLIQHGVKPLDRIAVSVPRGPLQ